PDGPLPPDCPDPCPPDCCPVGDCCPPCPECPTCPGCCNDQGCCRQGNGFYASAEYLLWWIKDGFTPPLVTTGPSATFGVLGQAGTQVLFGNSIDYGTFSGGRFTAGYWFNDPQTLGIEGSFFFLGQQSVNFFAASDPTGVPVLSRPFTGAFTGAQVV